MSHVSFPSDVADAYNEWSQTYETAENATRDLAAEVLRRQNLRLGDRDVLEIGCGTGLNTKYLAQESCSVTALDFSAGMLAEARRKLANQNVKFVQQDIQLEWAAADGSFDLIVCTLVLEHIENLSHVFAEAARVLRPGGEFFLSELHPFRQLRGSQANYTSQLSDKQILIPAFLHDVCDYVNAAFEHGFKLISIDEPRDADKPDKNNLPRLLSLRFQI